MSLIGLYCDRGELLLEIESAFHIVRLKNAQDSAAEHCQLQNLTSLTEEALPWQEEMPFLILACETADKTFAAADALWARNPGLSIICVARCPEDVFAALPYPFFHVVREFCLEQDLGAVLCKIARAGSLLPRWCTFQGKNELVRVRLKQVLYLESDRHAIRVYTKNQTQEADFLTLETLSQCEERLHPYGFARIHKSYLVNLYHVAKLEKERLTLDCGRQLYISRHRYPDVKLQFENYIRHLNFL
ncbi:MAG: LytTR family transcriptional regulator [Lachnospiraceae bacterium]|nr:LytTR family transcriptional regulator [Lachnospiraceae bacterium]